VAGVALVWTAIRLRPVLASSLERLESVTFAQPGPMDAAVLLEQQGTALEVRLAHAEARRGMELFR
jgi:hypothetical protein